MEEKKFSSWFSFLNINVAVRPWRTICLGFLLTLLLSFSLHLCLYADDAEIKLNSNDGSTGFVIQNSLGNGLFKTNSAGSSVVTGSFTVNGQVGIGTAAPGEKLEVGGNIKNSGFRIFTSSIQFGDGSVLDKAPAKYSGTGPGSVLLQGEGNTSTFNHTTVSGGYYNTATGDKATVGGGNNNTASGQYSTVSGGADNRANGEKSVVSGGYGNTASGARSSVPGGYQNTASGDYSFAAGHRSSATANGAYAVSDSQDADFLVNSPNVFGARFAGGYWFTGGDVGIGTTTPHAKLYLVNSAVAGAYYVPTADILTVENNANAYINIIGNPNSSAGINFSDDNRGTGYIQYEHNNNRMLLATNSLPRLVIDSAGSVGVGTLFPVSDALFQVGGGTLTVLKNGNVGIGTTSPTVALDVNGQIKSAGRRAAVTVVSTDYTVGDNDEFIIIGNSSVANITLPGTSAGNGRILTIKNASSTATPYVNPGIDTTFTGPAAINPGATINYILAGTVWHFY